MMKMMFVARIPDVPMHRGGCGRGFAAMAIAFALCSSLWAQTPGQATLYGRPGIRGNVVAVSPLAVEIEEMRTGELKKVPIEQLKELQFEGEPQGFKTARKFIRDGQPTQALEELDKIDKSEFEGADTLVLGELDFVRAAAVGGRAALTGAGLPAGEKAVQEYLSGHAQSHHAFQMQELLGKLLALSGRHADAAAALAPLEKGPPAYRIRGAAARARLFFDQGKFDEAQKEFAAAAAIDSDPQDNASARQKQEAELGRARCLSRQGKTADAITVVQGVLKAATPDDKELLGKAYNVLGDAYRAGGKEQDALIAFLTVELVYNTVGDDRAEALYNLAQLWEQGRHPERAREATEQLQASYPESPWARKLGAAKGS